MFFALLARLAASSGVLAADSYAGFNGLYEAGRAGGALAEMDSR